MKRIIIRKDCLDYITVLFMILCSGTVVFNIRYNSIFIPIFCLYTLIRGVSIGKYKRNLPVLSTIIVAILFNGFVHVFDGVAWNGLTQVTLYLIGTAVACSTMSFERYKKTYIELLSYLTVLSIIIFWGVANGLLGHSKVNVNGSFYQIALFHIVGWGDTVFNTRMCGLFHEPGMFQVILNIGILYQADNILKHEICKKDVVRLLLFAVGVLLTRSTTGYIVMCITLSSLYFKIKKYMKNKYLKVLYYGTVPACFFVGYKLLSSEVIVNKFSSNNISYNIRTNDFLSGILMLAKQPILGYGYNSKLYTKTSLKYGMDSMSNGIMGLLLMFGILLTILFLYFMVRKIRNTKWTVNKLIVIAVIMIEEMTESWFFFPVSLAFIFSNYEEIKCKGEDGIV